MRAAMARGEGPAAAPAAEARAPRGKAVARLSLALASAAAAGGRAPGREPSLAVGSDCGSVTPARSTPEKSAASQFRPPKETVVVQSRSSHLPPGATAAQPEEGKAPARDSTEELALISKALNRHVAWVQAYECDEGNWPKVREALAPLVEPREGDSFGAEYYRRRLGYLYNCTCPEMFELRLEITEPALEGLKEATKTPGGMSEAALFKYKKSLLLQKLETHVAAGLLD